MSGSPLERNRALTSCEACLNGFIGMEMQSFRGELTH